MSLSAWRGWGISVAVVSMVVGIAFPAAALQPGTIQEPPAPILVRGEIAVSSLMSLSDAHLRKMQDSLAALARSPEAASADWERIRGPLAELAKVNVEALVWFALPDGSYWSVPKGKASANLTSRAYFPRLLRGETVVGALVVSKATGRSSAIVAVPVTGADGKVVGVLGSSIVLQTLSEKLKSEMGLSPREIFYSFDRQPIVALDWEPHLILADPMKLEPGVTRAFREMLANEQGTVRYSFRGKERTVIYKRSSYSGWWYAFGVLEDVPAKP